MNAPTTREAPVDLGTESVAGEEDPGASIEPAARPRAGGASEHPGGGPGAGPLAPGAPMRPGDDAPEGTAGTGENVCPTCGGSGRQPGSACATCAGTGKVTVGIGGA